MWVGKVNRGKQQETYQAIFWPLMTGILKDEKAAPRSSSAGNEVGTPALWP